MVLSSAVRNASLPGAWLVNGSERPPLPSGGLPRDPSGPATFIVCQHSPVLPPARRRAVPWTLRMIESIR